MNRIGRMTGEGLVIITSILIAFGIQAWWDGRQERAEQVVMLEALAADFEAYDFELSTVAAYLRDLSEANQALVDSLSSVPEGESVVLADSSLRQVLGFQTLRIPLRGTDPLGIANPTLGGLIRRWEASVRTAVDRLDAARDLVFTQIRPLLGAGVDLNRLDQQAYELFVLEVEPNEGSVRVSPTLDLINAISARGTLLQAAARELTMLADLSVEVQELIAAELHTD